VLHEFLYRSLPGDDYQVIKTGTGEEFKSTLNETLPDLVILDIMMPRLDGIKLGLSLRQWSEVPILMLSTWGAGNARVRGLDLGGDFCLTEPFNDTELLTRVEETFRRNSVCRKVSDDYYPPVVFETTDLMVWLGETILRNSFSMN
jgi:DNA-binding response OmpR family regulator